MGHSHPVNNINAKFLIGILLNITFIIVEIIYGIKANSLALIADAVHSAGDICSLLIAWFGFFLAQRKAPKKFTYGYKNATIIAAFINAVLLFMAAGGIIVEAIRRLGTTEGQVASLTPIIVASIGVMINGLTAYFFLHNRQKDINVQGAFLHMLLDAAVSLGVVAAGFFIFWKSWSWVDPLISVMIFCVIFISSWQLLKESIHFILLATPASVDTIRLTQDLKSFKEVIKYHDLHIWPISTTETALSVHLIVKPESFQDTLIRLVSQKITEAYPISHVTIQLETEQLGNCCGINCS